MDRSAADRVTTAFEMARSKERAELALSVQREQEQIDALANALAPRNGDHDATTAPATRRWGLRVPLDPEDDGASS
jgi:hypothetical protein